MVHIYAIYVMKHNGSNISPTMLFHDCELSTFGFFKRRTVKELITFFCREIIQRTRLGKRP